MGIMALTIGLIICFIYFWLIDSLNELEEHQLFIIWILFGLIIMIITFYD